MALLFVWKVGQGNGNVMELRRCFVAGGRLLGRRLCRHVCSRQSVGVLEQIHEQYYKGRSRKRKEL